MNKYGMLIYLILRILLEVLVVCFAYYIVPNWFVIFFAVFVPYYIYIVTRNRNYFKKLAIPVPGRPWPVFGHMIDYQKKGVHQCDLEWMKECGKVYGQFEGTGLMMVISDTDILKQILIKDFGNFCDRRVVPGLNGDMEKSLTILKGERWKHVRNILTPTFSAGKLKRMMPLMTRASDVLVENMKKRVKDSNVVDMKRAFGGYSMDVITSTAFGIDVDSQSNPNDPLVENASKMFKFDIFRSLIFLMLIFPFALTYLIFLICGYTLAPKSSLKFFRELVLKLIKEREADKKEHKDFLQLMIEAKHAYEDSDNSSSKTGDASVKDLTVDEIVGQSILFLVAGYETTGSTLSMLSYNLALNPDKQQKLYDELVEKLGSEEPTYENVHELVYTEMCINETLRLFPPASRFDRVCQKETEIGGVKIPSQMIISVPVYAIHHCSEYWDSPEVFRPERFSPEEKQHINPLHFMPFGYGPRNCIGMRLAYIEAKVAVADFFRNFKVSVCEDTQIPPKFPTMGIMTPDKIMLKVEPRNK